MRNNYNGIGARLLRDACRNATPGIRPALPSFEVDPATPDSIRSLCSREATGDLKGL